jgi:hypothetical protein
MVSSRSDTVLACPLLAPALRAPRFARRRGEEEGADTLFGPRATTNKAATRRETRRAERAIDPGIARRRTEEKRAEALFSLRATTTAADSTRDARAAHKKTRVILTSR